MHDQIYLRPVPPHRIALHDCAGACAAAAAVSTVAIALAVVGDAAVGSRPSTPYISLAEHAVSCEALFGPKTLSAPDGIRPDCRARI